MPAAVKRTRAEMQAERRAAMLSAQKEELERIREAENLAAPITQRTQAAATVQGGELVAGKEVTKAERRKARDEYLKKLGGRPSGYSKEEADLICSWIAQGKSLSSYCRETGREHITVYRWLREEEGFAARYARAHDDRADTLADQITDIADGVQDGTNDQIQAARLRIDARKWVSAKLRPQRWGEKVEIEQKGNITFNLAPIRRVIDVSPHSDNTGCDSKPLIAQESAADN